MKQYITFFRIRFLTGLQYRCAALAGIVTQFVWGLLEILLFRAFYEANPSNFPMEFSELSAYIWLQQAFLALYLTWFFDNDIFKAITSGEIAYEMVRPVDIYTMWFMKSMSRRLSNAVLRCVPILVFAACLKEPYGLRFPKNMVAAIWFPISMCLALLVVVAFSMLIYIITFYTVSSIGVKLIASSLVEFLSGSVIPLPFLPEKIQTTFSILPFASMQNVPFRIYSGNISESELYVSIILQVCWVLILILLGKITMKRALKKVCVQGG